MVYYNSMLVKIALILFLLNVVFGQEACPLPKNVDLTCVCDLGDAGTIDLTSLANNNGSPKFPDIARINDNFLYSYNPCYGYLQGGPTNACGGDLGKVASCQYDKNSGDEFALSDASTETIYIDKATGNNYVQYTDGQDGRITKVYLICDPSAIDPKITADSDKDKQLTYVFHLTTMCACPGTCQYLGQQNPGPKVAPGIIGIVLIVLLLPAILTYFIVGAIIKKLLNNEITGTDMIPQKDLWFDLPFLIKDGVVFTFSPIISLINKRKDKDYEKL